MRTFLGRNTTFTGRDAVYETADAVEVQASNQYEVDQKRVLFEDVQLITLHEERGVAFLILVGAFAMLFLLPAAGLAFTKEWIGAAVLAAIALPFLIAFLLRIFLGVEVVSIFGRRSKAVIRFGWRRGRAREIYTHLIQVTRESQQRLVEKYAAENLPEPPEPEIPPPPERPILTFPPGG